MIAYAHVKIGSNSYEKVKTFKYLSSLLEIQNYIHEEMKCRFKTGNSCCYWVKTLLSSRLFSKNLEIKIYLKNIVSCVIWFWNMAFYTKGEIQTIGIWKQDSQASVLA